MNKIKTSVKNGNLAKPQSSTNLGQLPKSQIKGNVPKSQTPPPIKKGNK